VTEFAGLLLVAAALAVVDWVAVGAGGPRGLALERFAKPAVVVALAGAVLVSPAGAVDRVDSWALVLAALAASLAGDLLLLPPGRFVPGLVAFLGAHLAYLVALAQQPGTVPWLAIGIVVAAVVAATVGRALVTAARGTGLAAPVFAYLVVICAMAVAATRTGVPAAILGAWLFVGSDAMLGWARLGAPGKAQPAIRGTGIPALAATASSTRRGRQRRVAVMATYHLAQGLLVIALVGTAPT
jgi:uncharacterized membrane protein YhhN